MSSTILDAAGIVNLGYPSASTAAPQGAIGESNQYAAYIILFLPGMIAAAVASRGVRRLFWFGGALLVLHGAGHDGIARRLRWRGRWPAPLAPIYTGISSPTAASPAGYSDRWWCWSSS